MDLRSALVADLGTITELTVLDGAAELRSGSGEHRGDQDSGDSDDGGGEFHLDERSY